MRSLPDWLAQHSFRLKLVGVAVLAEIALVAALSYLDMRQLDKALTEQVRARIDQGTILFNAALGPKLAERDYTSLEQALGQARRDNGIEYAVLRDGRGKPVVAMGWDLRLPLPEADRDVRKAADGGLVHLRQSITLGGQAVGELHYGLTTTFLQNARRDLIRQTLLTAAAGILISVLALILLGFALTRRLGRLAEAARRLADGDLTVRIDNGSRDEIGRLGAAFNNMAAALENRMRELHASEARLALVMRGTTDGVWDWDVRRNISYFTTRFRELLGYDDEEEFRLMFHLKTSLHPDDRDRVLAAQDAALLHQSRFDVTYRLRCKDGSYRWFHGRGQVARDENGAATRFAGSLSDISEQKAAEEALRGSEERLFHALRGSSDGLWDWDVTQDRYFFSPRYRELLGYTEEELPNLRSSILDPIHPEDRPRVEEAVRRHFRERTPYDVEHRMRHKDGSYRWFRARGQAVWNADGRAVRFTGVSTDIEAQKQAQERLNALLIELQEEKALSDTLLAGLPGIVGLFDAQMRLLRWNRNMEIETAHPPERLRDLRANELFAEAERVRQASLIALERGIVTHGEATLRAAGGRLVPYYLYAAPILRGERKLIVGLGFDISERKQSEADIRQLNEELEERVRERTAELTAANKELESFSYSVSHDLVAPLRAIDGFSRMIEMDYGDKVDERGKDYIHRIRHGTQRMQQLIDDMLALSRVTRNEMKHQRIDLSALAGLIIADLRQAQPQREVDSRIEGGLFVQGDPNLMRIALENLLRNAWKFTARHASSRIEFGTLHTGDKPVYFVRDDGAGFDMQYAGKLFDAFQRMHRAQDFEGTGIGLAIVHRIIQRHGGRIWAEAAPERGATFFFTLS